MRHVGEALVRCIHRDTVLLGYAGDLGIEGEPEDTEQIDVFAVYGFAGGFHVRRTNRSVLRTDAIATRTRRSAPVPSARSPIAWTYSPA